MQSAWLVRSCSRIQQPRLTSIHTAFAGLTFASQPCRQQHSFLSTRRAFSSQPTAHHGPAPRVAVIGSGPAGFYTARKLMREVPGTKVDMYEQLPVPFGLVRFGVAPDHPEVKNCQDEFEQVASSPDYTFIGNVQLGQELPLTLLARHYDAIVFSYGASKDRQLGLQGEDNPHIYSARAFVGWYNGLPEYRDLTPDLQAGDTAVIVGQGNVAMDVARILLSPIELLQKTDLTSYAVDALSKSTIKHVHVVGRRGPVQAAFTIKEVRELIHLPDVNFTQIPQSLFPENLKSLARPKRRIAELLQKGKPHDVALTKSCTLEFLLAPMGLEISPTEPSSLTGITFTRTQLEDLSDPSSKVHATSQTHTLPATTLFRSIGYRAEPIPGMDLIGATFDDRKGTLNHDGSGRMISLNSPNSSESPPSNPSQAALYCAGWVKRGPTGVIASTMADAFETAEAIVADWRARLSSQPTSSPLSSDVHDNVKEGWPAVKQDAISQGYELDKVVDWDGWRRIDKAEKHAGQQSGKPREKFGRVGEMVSAAEI